MDTNQMECANTGATTREALPTIRPRTNLSETPDGFLLECALPGVDEKDVQVELEGSVLTLRAESRLAEASPNADGAAELRCVRAEFFPALYARSFRLGEGLDPASVRASLKHGLLRIDVRRLAPVQRRIEIKQD